MAVLAYEGCLASGVSGFADALAVGNLTAGRAVFTVSILGVDGSCVRGFNGAAVPVDAALGQPGEGAWDVAYIPPAFGTAATLAGLATWIKQAHASGTVVCAACAGVFALAGAGILQGREATTHWALAREFSQRYPDVRLDPGRILIDGGDYLCAGGVTAYFDLALRLLARFASPEAAAACARTLLLDPGRSSQTPYMSLLAPAPHADATVAKAQQWLEDNLRQLSGIGELAAALHVSERTLLRRFRKATGRTPKQYLQALRIELAKRLLATTGTPVEEVATQAGYADATAFHRLFKEMAGISPGQYRRRFSCFTPGAARQE